MKWFLGILLFCASEARAQQAVTIQPAPLACIQHAGTIASGGVSQQALAANPLRRGFVLQNPAGAANPRITFTTSGPASSTSVELQPGASFVSPVWGSTTAALNVWSNTTGAAFSLEECF